MKQGLQQVCPDAVALQFLPNSNGADIPEDSVTEYISCDENVEHYETVEPIYIYTMKEYADIFKSTKNVMQNFDCNHELVKTSQNHWNGDMRKRFQLHNCILKNLTISTAI